MLIQNTKVMNIRDKLPKVISYKIGKFIDMNKTIISIEVQDHGGKEANIIVRGERNKQIMFEEQFDYKDEEKHPLRLHLLSERFHRKFPQLGDSLGILCIRKLFNDITIRSKMKANPDYRTLDK